MKSGRRNVREKAFEECADLERAFQFREIGSRLHAERDVRSRDREDARIGDRPAANVAGEIFQNADAMRIGAEYLNHESFIPHVGEELHPARERPARRWLDRAGIFSLSNELHEDPAKHFGDDQVRNEKLRTARERNPPSECIDAARRKKDVHVRMALEFVVPSLKHRENGGATAEPLRIGEQSRESQRHGFEEDVAHHRWILLPEKVQLVRNREDKMEVLDRKETRLPLRQPHVAASNRAERTEAMPAGVSIQKRATALAALNHLVRSHFRRTTFRKKRRRFKRVIM